MEKMNNIKMKLDSLGITLTANFFSLPMNVLRKIYQLSEEDFSLIKSLVNDNIENISITVECKNEIIEYVITKKHLYYLTDFATDKQLIMVDESIMERINEVIEKTSFTYLFTKYSNTNFKIDLDGTNYQVPIIDILNLSLLDEEQFLEKIKKAKINGIETNKYVYIFCEFFSQPYIQERYVYPKTVVNRISTLYSYTLIDFEAINKCKGNEGKVYDFVDNIDINEKLYKEIVLSIPDGYNELEKAIHIYIKLAKKLIYSEKYFLNQNNEDYKRFDANLIELIGDKTFEAVCYEFNLIFAKFLRRLNINFSFPNGLEKYGKGHAYLIFRHDKYLIKADSLGSIFDSDLIRSKLNLSLNGLECINGNSVTSEEFSKILIKVYNNIMLAEGKIYSEQSAFEDVVNEYKKLINMKEVSLNDKFDIFISKARSSGFNILDVYSYMIKIKGIIFNKKELLFNMKMSIVRDDRIPDNEKAAIILTLNSINVKNQNDNTYFIYNDEGIKSITLEELQEYFDQNKFSYAGYNTRSIPGVKSEEGLIYVK